jgi:uncharacterized protein (DUF952 family)
VLYHLALRSDWDAAVASAAPYRVSTLGASLDDVGFVHCSHADQVRTIADLVYRGRDDVVLLEVDPARLRSEVRVEVVNDAGDAFPHVYGPIDLDAVVRVRDLALGGDGRLVLPPIA